MEKQQRSIEDFLLQAANLKKDYLDKRLKKNEVVYISVDKSTIRSFHYAKECSKKYKPLSVFRYWAWHYISERDFEAEIKEKNFQRIRELALINLMEFWKNEDNGSPSFAQFNKLIDLFFKHLCLLDNLSESNREFFFNNSNVPLDKYSLGLLSNYAPDLNIPANVSMGHVDQLNYNVFQRRIVEICKNYAPLTFDLYAWNAAVKVKPIPSIFKLIPLSKTKVAKKDTTIAP